MANKLGKPLARQGDFLTVRLAESRIVGCRITAVLKGEGETQTLAPEHCYRHRVSSAAFNKWCNRFTGIESSLIARSKEL